MTSSFSSAAPVTRRPAPCILAVGLLFIAIGALDVYRGVAALFGPISHVAIDDMQELAVGTAALVGGGFVLRGQNWARWLLAVWMLLHVAISVGHPRQLIAHLVIFGAIALVLFRPRTWAYFGPTTN